MSKSTSEGFELRLDARQVTAFAGESLWQVAQREGERIPHLCFKDAPGYRSDGNCRACMVEIAGERVLAASCHREAKAGMVVKSATSERARVAREGVLELLAADQPPREQSPDRASHFWQMADLLGVDAGRARLTLGARYTEDTKSDRDGRSLNCRRTAGFPLFEN